MIDYATSLRTESMPITKVRRNDLKLEQQVVFGKARGFVLPVELQTNWLIILSRRVIEVRDGQQHVCSSINEFVKVLLEMVPSICNDTNYLSACKALIMGYHWTLEDDRKVESKSLLYRSRAF